MPRKLSELQIRILATLREQREVPNQEELASLCKTYQPTISRLVKELIELGLVERNGGYRLTHSGWVFTENHSASTDEWKQILLADFMQLSTAMNNIQEIVTRIVVDLRACIEHNEHDG